jgi:hypothetical protein
MAFFLRLGGAVQFSDALGRLSSSRCSRSTNAERSRNVDTAATIKRVNARLSEVIG